jgi:hypothetical protein
MTQMLLTRTSFYLTKEQVERLDKIRGYIPCSRLGVLAVNRLLDDIETGRVNLMPEIEMKSVIGDALSSINEK